ncbi:MAG TPA: hypothetical protein PLV68_04690, partial [Ilumatobacteraceae bacterium]|nr:hypothetical protein [Ilumatobacteraceae bacterium]
MVKWTRAVAVVAAGALALASCGSDDGDSSPTSTAPVTTQAEVTTTTAAPTTTADNSAASDEVAANVVELFDQLAIAGNPDTSPADAEAAVAAAAALIEGGDSEEVLAQVPRIAGLAAAAQLTIVIDEAPVIDGDTATYKFSALSFGNPSQLNKANGVSVLENGVWKLSSDIWAAFLAMGGDSNPEDMGGGDDDSAASEEVAANVVELFD